MEKLKTLFFKHKSFILYAVFGVLTTLVNIISFQLLTTVINLTPDSTLVPNIIANILAILFAFVTNRTLVFESDKTENKDILIEAVKFFMGRGVTMLLDLLIVYVLVDIVGFSKLMIKIISNVIVILLNYVISKLYVFRKNKTAKQ